MAELENDKELQMKNEKLFCLQEEIKKLPNESGVYLMRDEKDQVIYVGKAINLKNRVRQYFQNSRNMGIKIDRMVSHIQSFEVIVTASELDALVLENNLIKEYRPKYNTMLTDDKTYPFVKVTVNEAFPRVFLTRKMTRDKGKVFGPFTSGQAVKEIIELVGKLYRIRTCNRNLPKNIGKERPCLNYHIKQCDAPCMGNISKEDYGESVQKVLEFLSGNYLGVEMELEKKMNEASKEMKYELAHEYKELLENVKKIEQKQNITDANAEDRDILALAIEGNDAVVQVFFMRSGRIIGREHFYLKSLEGATPSERLESFIKQYYGGTPFIPKELLLQVPVEDIGILEQWLSKKRGGKVNIKIPQKGSKEKLVEMAANNAKLVLTKDMERIKQEERRTLGAVKEIENCLGLENINRMEAFDISNISGFESVASMVVYEKGKPKKNDYRKFKIKTVQGIDDYGSLKEVLSRRFIHGLSEQKENKDSGSFDVFPDLILMDGGKGQVNVAKAVLMDLKLNIPVCGLVKDEKHRTRGIFYKNQEIELDRHSQGFRLITRIQEEAHRFAISYHRSLRSKKMVRSILDEIEGVGPARRKALMEHFASIEKIKEASIEELRQVPRMNERVAKSVLEFLREK